ncbi:hypothetical protein OOK44_21090 [Streptomyces cellulosae]|uniref:hypothetical protein n=1 Tax=Streptomyces cellulosae TaxID=1968 RepID=UPI0022532983|nr:hypothetical protein [Streptomyces cellulosae]WTB82140.1 hypothetical protein OG837_13120 [Streptomyces cellulosae]WTB89039.1 hypothetical protein OIE99_12685 [Streptomyces cellulosae]WTC56328.1 hypothetical protein OH715_14030 [Streptomyces cellulosae]
MTLRMLLAGDQEAARLPCDLRPDGRLLPLPWDAAYAEEAGRTSGTDGRGADGMTLKVLLPDHRAAARLTRELRPHGHLLPVRNTDAEETVTDGGRTP